MRRLSRPFLVILERMRKIMKKIIITPIKYGTLLNPQPTSIPFVSFRGVAIRLFDFHGEVEELAPNMAGLVHEIGWDPVVDDLEESPLLAGLSDPAHGGPDHGRVAGEQACEVNQGDVDDVITIPHGVHPHRPLCLGLDVAVRYAAQAALRERLDSDNGLRPVLAAIHLG